MSPVCGLGGGEWRGGVCRGCSWMRGGGGRDSVRQIKGHRAKEAAASSVDAIAAERGAGGRAPKGVPIAGGLFIFC